MNNWIKGAPKYERRNLNLLEAIRNLENLIRANVFNRETNISLSIFGKDFFNLCKSTELDIKLSDVTKLSSYNQLLDESRGSRNYTSSQIENFFNEWIVPTRIEIYGY